MASDDYSCIKEIVKTVHISLPPSYSFAELSGVMHELETWKSQYVSMLGGIVVGYSNVKFVSKMAQMFHDDPYIHCDATASFSVFRPCVGSILKGRINRISRQHVGCLVHDCINVSIQLSQDVTEDFSRFISLDSEILFQVTHVDVQKRVIRVKGKVTPECIELMQQMFPEQQRSVHTFFTYSDEDENKDVIQNDKGSVNGESDETVANSPKKKKRKNVINESMQDNILSFLHCSLASLSDANKSSDNKKLILNNNVKNVAKSASSNISSNLTVNQIKIKSEDSTKLSENAQKEYELLNYNEERDMHEKVVENNVDNITMTETSKVKNSKKKEKHGKNKLKTGKSHKTKTKHGTKKETKRASKKKDKSKKFKDKSKKLKDKLKNKKDKLKAKIKTGKKIKPVELNFVHKVEIKHEV